MFSTRFERARIIGARALQIAMGAPVLFSDAESGADPIDLASREFGTGSLPINVARLPHGDD